jgi:hypothetical protein
MYANVLNKLLAGQFICSIAFESEYEQLQGVEFRAVVEDWLDKLQMRLARLGTDGAFFMAPVQVLSSHAKKVSDELASFRDVYGPAVRMLDLIRQAKESFTCSAGDYIQLAELETGLNDSSTLETLLRNLHGVIPGASIKHNNREFLKRLLDYLKSSGYLILVNPQNETYQVTGKIDQLHAVLEFIAEQKAVIGDLVDDKLMDEETSDLLKITPGAVDV